jgi:hypothetical protein
LAAALFGSTQARSKEVAILDLRFAIGRGNVILSEKIFSPLPIANLKSQIANSLFLCRGSQFRGGA